jgi:N-acyl homoserine lactone hydrolase
MRRDGSRKASTMERAWARRMLLATVALAPLAAGAQAGKVDRLYDIDCGWAHITDQSVYSPGVNVGVPIDLSDNCYLIHHTTAGYLLWDSGITDRTTAQGERGREPGMTWHRTQTLVAALAALGLTPADVRYIVVSHFHPDHVGNVDEFPTATLIMQRTEWDYAMTQSPKPFNPAHTHQLVQGDTDLLGDGSLVILSTPGHTPGHESLLVHLQKTGYIVLSGDVVHFQSNWDHRRVPSFNTDSAQSVASMNKVARVLADKHAQFWINHDKPSSDARRHAPAFYE